MKVSLTNLLEVDHDHFEVISMLEELKKSKLLVSCALNNNFCAIMNARVYILGNQYMTGNKDIITDDLIYVFSFVPSLPDLLTIHVCEL